MRWNPFRRAPVVTTVADHEITPVAARPTAPATPARLRGGHTSSDVPYTLPKVTDRPAVGATVPAPPTGPGGVSTRTCCSCHCQRRETP